MHVNAAQLPSGGGDDTIVTTDDAVIMLDGASAFGPAPVAASVYSDHLAKQIARLMHTQDSDLRGILADAISATARELELKAGESPSSTVVILRQTGDYADCLVLGDSLAVLAGRAITDDRLSQIGRHRRELYRDRLAEGHGYDQQHQRILHELQHDQARLRNRQGGYWIAETDPNVAQHAVTQRLQIEAVPWAVLATDGAYKTMAYLGFGDWGALRNASSHELADLLKRCQSWEASEDPEGQKLPRAKRHDDKTLAVVCFNA